MADFFPLPYRYISGLTRQQQQEIWRDFEAVAQRASSASGFDAIIDPLATTSAASHTYKNISDFSVGEAANITSSHVMIVRVIGRPGTSIVETSNITLNGPVVFMGGGITAGSPFSPGGRPVIDFNGHTITVAGSNWVTFQQLELANTGGVIVTLVTGNIGLYDSMVNAVSAGASSILIVASALLYAHNTGFSGNLAHGGIRTYCFDCVQEFPVAGVIVGGSTQYFVWDGGSFDTGQASCGITVTAAYYIDATYDSFMAGSSTGNAFNITLGNSSTGYLSIHSVDTLYPNLTINTLAGDAVVDGAFGSVTVNGSTNHGARNLRLSIPGGGGIDLTGPCKADVSISNAAATSFIKLRGLGNHVTAAMETLSGGTTPLQLIGCTDSVVVMQLPAGSPVAPYTIDAASARCVVVLAGVTDGWAAGTNAGTNCLVITETGVAGSATADSTRKDLIPALLVGDVAGVQTIPVPAPGSAPTGPAGASLNGTYPNPSFSGRDSSVDQINRDMLPAMLVEANGPFGVNVYGQAQDSALAQTHDLSGTWPYMKVTGISGQKVTGNSPADQDVLQYITGFSVGWVNIPPETISRQTKDYTKDFMLMGG